MAPNPLRSRMVLTQGFGVIILPLIAVGLAKYYGDSPDEKEKRMEVNFEEKLHAQDADRNLQQMHEFIRQQATNPKADYSEILASGRGKVKRQKDLER